MTVAENLDKLRSNLVQLTEHGIDGMSEQEIKEYRKSIVNLNRQCKAALADTSTKQHDYDDVKVVEYINTVLDNAYNLVPTKLSDNQYLIDAQHLTWWKNHIKACVDNSQFSEKAFKIDWLSVQRSAIEQATTLHELRQAVRAMIGPLSMYREFTTVYETEYDVPTEEQLLQENERLVKELEDKTRKLKEITKLYDEPLEQLKNKKDLVTKVEEYKKEHNCSDDDACLFFDVSRSTLKRARKDVAEMTSA